jgi:hypothetical protein
MPEPVPCGTTGSMMPGPLPPVLAPAGPPDELSLPANHLSAFTCPCPQHDNIYVHVGGVAYQRQRLGNLSAAYLDPNVRGLDTGLVPPRPNITNSLLDFDDITPNMAWGAKAALGYITGDYVVELSGYYIPQTSSSREAAQSGRMNSFFINPPLGFEGNNNLWLQADRMIITQQTTLGNGELNVRYSNRSIGGFEPILGIRYLDLQERFSFYTGDDDVFFRDINSDPDKNRQATYSVRMHNHIVAPQLGAELQYPFVNIPPKGHWVFGLFAKGAWGINFWDRNFLLRRGDDFVGIDDKESEIQFTHLYELGTFIDFYAFERVRVRAGYNVMWVVNVPEAVDQLNFDLSNLNLPPNERGSIFFHGPSVEMQILF